MRPTSARLILFLGVSFATLSLFGCSGASAPEEVDPPRIRVSLPPVVLRDVPVKSVTIEVLTPDGKVDTNFTGEVTVKGLRIVRRGGDREKVTDEPANLKIQAGVLASELTSDLGTGRRVFVSDDFEVGLAGATETGGGVFTAGFWSLLPPIIAIGLAIWLKDVYIALLAAVYSGCLVLAGWNPVTAFTNMMNPDEMGILSQASNGWNMQVIIFTLFLGAMVQIMSVSGGTQAVVNRLSRVTSTRERGQLLTWFMGLLIFFDDYANTMLVGNAMRPVTDRLKISREKLAFLIDSTAAPIAGLAIVSTWVGVEVSNIGIGLDSLGVDESLNYAVFLKTIPYRFYPLFLIGFVMLISVTGRDFGPMSRAERKALESDAGLTEEATGETQVKGSIWYAILPVAALVGWIMIGFANGIVGEGNLLARAWAGLQAVFSGDELVFVDGFDSVPLLLHASFFAAMTAAVLAMGGGTLNLRQTAEAWIKGMTEMFPALIVLVLAWSVSSICKDGGLNTAGFIIEQIGDGVSPKLMPTLAFVVAGAVAFAVGSSYATMGLLIPLFISLVGYMLAATGLQDMEVVATHSLMLATVGAILAGSIFGDHCSPISDTTVLSSAGAKCNHLAHVATQMPYALTVGAIAILCGYLPAGYGMNPWLMLPIGLVVCLVVIFVVGRRAEPAS